MMQSITAKKTHAAVLVDDGMLTLDANNLLSSLKEMNDHD